MNLFRLILLLAAAWLIWRLYKSLRPQIGAQRPEARPQSPPQAYEPMARCARCGVHAPAGSLSSAGLCGRCGE